MSKLLVIPNNKDLNVYKNNSFIVGLKDFSINFNITFTLEEIKKMTDKEIFVSINKNIFEDEIESLKEVLLELDKTNIKGIIFYDLAIPNLKEKLKLKKELIWHQEHMTNNYLTVNFFNKMGINKTFLSSDITLNEIKEIASKTKSTLFVPILGYQPIFTSRRNLVKNYINFFNLKNDDEINYMYKEEKTYPIIDRKDGTVVYSDNILCGLEEYKEIGKIVDYVVLDSFLIEDNLFNEIIDIFKNEEYEKIDYIKEKLPNADTGFLHKHTIYKVK